MTARTPRPRKPPKPVNPEIPALAVWFIEDFLEQKWEPHFGGMLLGTAKRLLSPSRNIKTGESVPGFQSEDIKECLLLMRGGYWDDAPLPKKIDSLYCVLWGTPPYITRLPPPVPSIYHGVAYDHWVRRWGKRAIQEGKWDGIYRGWDGSTRTPEGPDGMSYRELQDILGLSACVDALSEYERMLVNA